MGSWFFFFFGSIYIPGYKPEAKTGRNLLTTFCGILLGGPRGAREVTCEAS